MKKCFRFVSVFLTAICCLGVTCCYAEGTSEDHGELLLCEYSILGGMENEHLVMKLTQGSGADILTVEEEQEGYDWVIEKNYQTSWHALSDLEEYISHYDPESWAELPYAEIYALDAPTEYLRVVYADGSEFSINSDKEQPEGSGSLMGDVCRYMKSYRTKGEPPFELLSGDAPTSGNGSLTSGEGSLISGAAGLIVGTDIAVDEIQEFYYTYASSTYPPEYQRYHFSAEDGIRLFSHETREGDHFPLTEADITVSGQAELSDDEWAAFVDCVKKGKVKSREDDIVDGDAGPWLYLYWSGDQGKYQEFSFASLKAQNAFEELCAFLSITQ